MGLHLPPGVTIELIRQDDTGPDPDAAERQATGTILTGKDQREDLNRPA
jgi:hypothetical protein